MDLIGKTFRDFLSAQHNRDIKKANAMAFELNRDGLRRSEIEEMLYASGYESHIVKEAMESLPKAKKH